MSSLVHNEFTISSWFKTHRYKDIKRHGWRRVQRNTFVLFYGVYHAGKKRIKNTKITLFHFDTFNEMKQKEIKL